MSAFLRFVQKKHSYVSWQKHKKIHKKGLRANSKKIKSQKHLGHFSRLARLAFLAAAHELSLEPTVGRVSR